MSEQREQGIDIAVLTRLLGEHQVARELMRLRIVELEKQTTEQEKIISEMSRKPELVDRGE